MKRTASHIVRLGGVLVGLLLAARQPSAAQQLKVNGGNPTLTVTTGIAGGTLVDVQNTTCSLRYRRQARICKITVQTSCPGQKFSLRVLATSVSDGVAAPEVTLVDGNPAIDIVTNIPNSGFNNGSCNLRYTVSATFAQGNSTELGNDVHTITYTLQAQ